MTDYEFGTWIDVKDMLPKERDEVLVWVYEDGHQHYMTFGWIYNTFWHVKEDIKSLYRVEYWMPLPEPPSESQ